ncbi:MULTISPECIES: hypothetical protein [unclassified Cryobacterium]|nr:MULTISPECIES: hypothetical protein [unclassified Cryobacterium]
MSMSSNQYVAKSPNELSGVSDVFVGCCRYLVVSLLFSDRSAALAVSPVA